MDESLTIEPVPPARLGRVCGFLAGGGEKGPDIRARADGLERMLRSRRPLRSWPWWARRGRQCVAAATVMEHLGAVGFLLCAPLDGPDVAGDAQAETVRRATAEARGDGLNFVQDLLEPGDRDRMNLLQRVGYDFLAELVYMELDVSAPGGFPPPAGVQWRTHAEFAPSELVELIGATYKDSLDCPKLVGRRNVLDVIASHRSSGRFRPESWYIVDAEGVPAGCVLVNALNDECALDVVYMGVRPAFRGRGLGRAMMQLAAWSAHRSGVRALSLAVDSRNCYAKRLYDSMGFVCTRRRIAMVDLGGSAET